MVKRRSVRGVATSDGFAARREVSSRLCPCSQDVMSLLLSVSEPKVQVQVQESFKILGEFVSGCLRPSSAFCNSLSLQRALLRAALVTLKFY